MIYRIIIFSCLLAFMSCSKSDSCTEVSYSEAFKIEADESYCFDDGTELQIRSINNEFCPCEAVCIWEGQMTVDMTWTFPGQDPLEFIHNGASTVANEELPMGLLVASNDTNIEFEKDCTESDPSPEIISALISVVK